MRHLGVNVPNRENREGGEKQLLRAASRPGPTPRVPQYYATGSAANQASMSAFQAALRVGEASDASIEDRARSARASSDSPNTSRATSYWATRRERNSSCFSLQ